MSSYCGIYHLLPRHYVEHHNIVEKRMAETSSTPAHKRYYGLAVLNAVYNGHDSKKSIGDLPARPGAQHRLVTVLWNNAICAMSQRRLPTAPN